MTKRTDILHTAKFEVDNSDTDEVQFTAEIEVTSETTTRFKLGLAVKWGKANGADLRGAYLHGADLSGADLSGTDLSRADLRGADLSRADLRGADLRGAILRDANLFNANLNGAHLINADLRRADLRGADLSGADLSGAFLSNAYLTGFDLRGANLRGSDLRGADLRGSDLRGADLFGSDLRGADLRGAILRGADLRGANLRSADLRCFKADFFMTVLHARSEVPYLIAALKEGHVDGSQYEGECACLVGTLANGSGKNYSEVFADCSIGGPAEQWFMMISKGDKAGDDSGGGFAAQKALEWAEEFLALMGKE